MSTGHSRRSFLANAAAWTAAVGLGPYLGACESCKDVLKNRPMRKSLATLAPNDPIIESYRVAVAAMKALPASDLRSWQHQAEIHNNFCPHGNWFFLPWHRAYLLYFEQICRKLSGNADFALPYWDWTETPSIPGPFWSGTLNDTTRGVSQTDTADPSFVGRPVIDSILAEPDFLLFASGTATSQRQVSTYGRLEGRPHNYVHGWIQGNMATYLSPLDPVFWMHHNMIECLWVDWNIVKQNPNTNDAGWSNFSFNGNFADADGNPVDVSVGLTLLMPLLSYQYDGRCGGLSATAAAKAQADTAALRRFLKAGAPPRLEVVRRFEARRGFSLSTEAPVSADIPVDPAAVKSVVDRSGVERLLLTIADLRQPAHNSFFVRVFVNLPTADPRTPTNDPHFAGSFAFFNDAKAMGHEQEGAGAFIVDASETIRRLVGAGEVRDGAPVQVRLVAVPIHEGVQAAADSFGAGRMELALARVREK